MSDQSQGPGWWQASDGKWYPPEQAPTPTPPPATQPIGPPPGAPPGAGIPGPTPPGTTPPGAPPYVPPASGGGGNTGKIIAVVIALALIAGGVAFALTRGGGGSSGSVKAFCDTAKKFQNDESLNTAFNDPSKIDKVLSAFSELVKAAPKEIKADMQTLQDAVNKLGQAVKSAGNDPSKVFGAILAASAGLDENKLNQAEANIEKFGKEKCGSDFSFSNSSSENTDFSTSFSFDSSSFSFDSDSFSSELSSASSVLGSDFFSSFSSELNSSSSS